jgi:mannosyltransferase OCH1-like enzyme
MNTQILTLSLSLICNLLIYSNHYKLPTQCIECYKTVLPFIDVNFNASMQTQKYQHIIKRDKTKQLVGYDGKWLIDYFRESYNQVSYNKIIPSQTLKIPKIIHQIWIGDEFPEELKGFQQSIKDFHPDWHYQLWTQDDIEHLNFVNKDLINLAQNPAEKSDLMRYELLYKFGGVYLDADCQMLQPLDMLHYMYDFYIGIQPLDTGIVQLGIGVIGSKPQHPILKKCIELVGRNYLNPQLSDCLTARTGPIHFTRIFVKYANKNNTLDIALPAHYFYPLGSTKTQLHNDHWRSIGSFTIHHWAKTWNKPIYRRPQFKTIKSYGTLL